MTKRETLKINETQVSRIANVLLDKATIALNRKSITIYYKVRIISGKERYSFHTEDGKAVFITFSKKYADMFMYFIDFMRAGSFGIYDIVSVDRNVEIDE